MKKPSVLFLLLFWVFNSFSQTVTLTKTNGVCISDGSITTTASGFSGALSYELLNGASIQVTYQPSNVFSNLAPGTYRVVVQENINNAITDTSSAVTITTSYTMPTISIPNGIVPCATATSDSLVVTVSGGHAPYSCTLSGGTLSSTASLGPQTSKVFTFYGLGAGTYLATLTDSCGTVITKSPSILVDASVLANFKPAYNVSTITYGNIALGHQNTCADGPYIWAWDGWSGPVNGYSLQHYYWRYVYPAGSGNIYGAGGVLNAAKMPMNSTSAPMPATATYPFSNADFIFYDECGDSLIKTNVLQNNNNWSRPTAIFTCANGDGVTMGAEAPETVCLPLVYTFTDTKTGTVIQDTVTNSGLFAINPFSFYGFVPGDTYTYTVMDGMSHNLYGTLSLTMASGVGIITHINPIPEPWIWTANPAIKGDFGLVQIDFPYPVPPDTAITVKIISSTSTLLPVGTTYSYTYRSEGLNAAQQFGARFYPPLVSQGGGYAVTPGINSSDFWPVGTYTFQVSVGNCVVNDDISFTLNSLFLPTIVSDSIVPSCSNFNMYIKAKLDVPGNYTLKVLAGSASQVGTVIPFNATKVGDSLYNSAAFSSLTYGTYYVQIYNGINPQFIDTISYSATSSMSYNASASGGVICSGNTTGNLIISATGTNTPLTYSVQNGGIWSAYQPGNTFSGMTAGAYPVRIKDACGNIDSGTANMVPLNTVLVNFSSNPICKNAALQLNLNAPGGTAYAWTGPNGFSSSIQNPLISNIGSSNAGYYSVNVTTATCGVVNAISDSLIVNVPNSLTSFNYPASPVCANGTTMPTITNPGSVSKLAGTFSSTAGLAINQSTGLINLATSIPGAYTVNYLYADSSNGCTATTNNSLTINPLPIVATTNQASCSPSTINLTAAAVTTGSTAGLSYSYYTDSAATQTLSNPAAVSATGKYYIMGVSGTTGCAANSSVLATINAQPTVSITNPTAVCSPGLINLTSAGITAGSSSNQSFGYFTNAAATTILSNPSAVGNSGTYYIKGTNTLTGCSSSSVPVLAVINIPTVSSTNTSICSSALPYTWNGVTFNAAGTQTAHLTNSTGCDSAASLNLSVINSSSSNLDTTISYSKLPFIWNGQSYNTAGNYSMQFTNAAGCDSVANLHLLVNATLPIILERFDAVAVGSEIELNWVTAQEINSSFIEVERSADGNTFTGIQE